MFSQIFRPSANRWYAELVLKTNSRDSAELMSECGRLEMLIKAAACGFVIASLRYVNDRIPAQQVINSTGPRMLRRIAEFGSDNVLCHQSLKVFISKETIQVRRTVFESIQTKLFTT